jgi:hypothetical protein
MVLQCAGSGKFPQIRHLCAIHDPCHKQFGATPSTYSNRKYFAFAFASTLAYIIRDPCYMAAEATQPPIVTVKCCTYTVSRSLTYMLLPTGAHGIFSNSIVLLIKGN